MPAPSTMHVKRFQKILWEYFAEHKRAMPWREPEADGTFDPYKIWLSEIMLQQTQVSRVVPKYLQFLERFPTAQSLAAASLGEVLKAWSGLGYNRRAKYLWQAAQMAATGFNGEFPRDVQTLQKLPGIGANTAGAIVVYAFDQPAIFIETNIRTVFIHHFFTGQTNVSDIELRPLLAAALAGQPPREFYWALMDYGAYLKSTVGNASRASKGYVKQPAFQGSRRQIRGHVILLLTAQPLTQDQLADIIADKRLEGILEELVREQLIQRVDNSYKLL